MSVPRDARPAAHREPQPDPRQWAPWLRTVGALLLAVAVGWALVVVMLHIGDVNHREPLVVVPSTYGAPGPSGGTR
jgi:hypothetical protein